ncbi:MAG: UDP-glucose 6-dehydrogenase, partial [Flavobacteriales bacterium]|nr:UDP-glucose 6-dehydrogenase [Flavobacteriales bacterium]
PNFDTLAEKLNNKVIFDGRNLYDLDKMESRGFYYKSIGRETVENKVEA